MMGPWPSCRGGEGRPESGGIAARTAAFVQHSSAISAEMSGHLGFCERLIGIQSSENREIVDRKTGIVIRA
jgi:hypothetical protein